MQKMKATVFHGPNDIRVEEVPRPRAGAGEAVIRITLTTICGTDLHILRGEYPVKPGLVIGHEPVGVIEELGEGVTGYEIGDRVLVGAITPCGQCRACLSAQWAQCGHGEGVEAIGGWRFGNTINGAQAEYLLVPNAQANLAKIPDELTRRTSGAARRHRFDRIQRRGVGENSHRRHGGRFCAGTDRPLRDGGREIDGRVVHHRRRKRSGADENVEANGRRRRARSEAVRCRCGSKTLTERRRGCRDRSARPPGNIRKLLCVACGRAGR